jgi:hypothetical protein
MSVHGVRLTERDLRWLEWMTGWRFVTGAAVVREFERRGESAPSTVVDRRLRGFTQLGLVEYERVLANAPRLYWLTRTGMQAAGVEGAVVSPKFADIRHDLVVLDVAHWLSSERVPSHQLVTEREIRRTETPNQFDPVEATYSMHLPERATHSRVYPDLVSVNPESGRAWGHEVECSRKDHRRLVRLMLAYGEAARYAGAVYYPTENVRDTVQRAADEANQIIQERYARSPIHVQPWPVERTST